MDQKRLTGLALMNVHRDIDIDVDKVIDRFAKSGKRRMPFICNFTGVFLNVLFFVPEVKAVQYVLNYCLFYLSLPSRCSLIFQYFQ